MFCKCAHHLAFEFKSRFFIWPEVQLEETRLNRPVWNESLSLANTPKTPIPSPRFTSIHSLFSMCFSCVPGGRSLAGATWRQTSLHSRSPCRRTAVMLEHYQLHQSRTFLLTRIWTSPKWFVRLLNRGTFWVILYVESIKSYIVQFVFIAKASPHATRYKEAMGSKCLRCRTSRQQGLVQTGGVSLENNLNILFVQRKKPLESKLFIFTLIPHWVS